MHRLVEELDRQLKTLDAATAAHIERLLREVMALADGASAKPLPAKWPPGYFERTSGSLAGEEFERPAQGDMPVREAL